MTKVAIVQFKASTDKNQNLKKILNYIKNASKRGAELCAFPEFMMFYTNSYQTPKQLANLSETINGNFISVIAKTAKENHIQVVGSFYEKSRKKDRVYDTSFIIDTYIVGFHKIGQDPAGQHDTDIKSRVVDGKSADNTKHQDRGHEHHAGNTQHLAAGFDGQNAKRN